MDVWTDAFLAHNFFEEQPIKGAAVYMMRAILHDWSDTYATKILKRLRDAASPESKLVLVEAILQHTCPSPEEYADIPGAVVPPAPAPLLANYGIAKELTDYSLDYVVSTSSYSPCAVQY